MVRKPRKTKKKEQKLPATNRKTKQGEPPRPGPPALAPRLSTADFMEVEPPSPDDATDSFAAAPPPIPGGLLSENFAPPSRLELFRRMPPDPARRYSTPPTGYYAAFVAVKHGWLTDDDRERFAQADEHAAAIMHDVPRLVGTDFSSLLEPDLDWAERTTIESELVDKMTACAIHYDLELPTVARFLGGEYTGEWRDADKVVAEVKPYVSAEDCRHIHRLLTTGAPYEFDWDEPTANKESFLRQGNSKTVSQHHDAMEKAMVKETRLHHVIPFRGWTAWASPFARATPQTINMKNPEKPRPCWDGSTARDPHQIPINEVTPTENEAAITFGNVFLLFLTWIYNLRAEYPDEDILLAFVDISSCFKYARIHASLIGAFGFLFGGMFFASNAMVFGSVVSAPSWEPMRRAIVALAGAYFARTDLVQKYWSYLSKLDWAPEPPAGTTYVQATRCSQNRGIRNANGSLRLTPHFCYVDDNMMADTRQRIPFTLAAALEAIFTVMGHPFLALRQSAVAMDKWVKLRVAHSLVLLGLVVDTRQMTVALTTEYRHEVLSLVTDFRRRETFSVNELEKLTGKLCRVGQAFRPIYHLMPHLYASSAHALGANQAYLTTSSKKFRKLLKDMRTKPGKEADERVVRHAIKEAARMKHRCNKRFFINATMREELRLIEEMLRDESIALSTPIAHMVPRDYTWSAYADACKTACGGWSTDLKFYWHYAFLDEVVRRARLPNNQTKELISINALEMAAIIINFAAAIVACDHDGIDLSTFPVLMNGCDNTAACAWIMKKCKTSLAGRALGRLFMGLLMSTNISIQTEWLSTDANFIADDISRLKKEQGFFDYASLLKKYPSLRFCREFKPSSTLLGMISDCLLSNASPDPLTLARSKPNSLGSITSSSS